MILCKYYSFNVDRQATIHSDLADGDDIIGWAVAVTCRLKSRSGGMLIVMVVHAVF